MFEDFRKRLAFLPKLILLAQDSVPSINGSKQGTAEAESKFDNAIALGCLDTRGQLRVKVSKELLGFSGLVGAR